MEKNLNKNEMIEEIEINEEVKVEELSEETLDEVDGGILALATGVTLGYWSVCYLAGIAHGYCK